jgi:hypothetical protein
VTQVASRNVRLGAIGGFGFSGPEACAFLLRIERAQSAQYIAQGDAGAAFQLTQPGQVIDRANV